jgi:hypothetical protein
MPLSEGKKRADSDLLWECFVNWTATLEEIENGKK